MNRLLAAVVMLLWAGGAGAGDSEYERETMKGLEGVEVLIADLDQDEIADGLTKQQLQTDVELRLRKVGIKVLTEKEGTETPGRPALYVSTFMAKNKTALYACGISAELKQGVALFRNPDILTWTTTWSTSSIGGVGENNMVQVVRRNVGDKVDEFINAYLSVNPITPQR